MNISPQCMLCLLRKQEALIRSHPEHKDPTDYIKQVMKIMIQADDEDTMPWIADRIQKYASSQFTEEHDYAAIKQFYNDLLMSQEEELQEKIYHAQDPLSYAIRLARCGNYIDFGALQTVNNEFLSSLLLRVEEEVLDPLIYQQFQEDMEKAASLLYLCDNCGEIVLDKLLIQELQSRYPHIVIRVMVRGGEVINDATMVDVKQIKLNELVNCVDSGVPLAGCDLRHISEDARKEILNADIILAKGQANFESLYGNKLPIYYLFLCKCEQFTQRFQMKQFEGVFTHEDALQDM